jgi:hypothetical protein
LAKQVLYMAVSVLQLLARLEHVSAGCKFYLLVK